MSYNSPYPPAQSGGYYGTPIQGYGGHAPPPPQQQQQAPPQQYGAGGGYSSGAPQYGQGAYGHQQPPQQQQSGYGQQQQGGYYGAPPPPALNQGPNPQQLQQWFNSVDTDRSGAITELELKQALINGDWSPFSDETIKMLMNMFDVDRTATIGFQEFEGLWRYIKEWQGVFRTFDHDRSGTIEGRELSNALSQFGYNLSPRLIDVLQKKYRSLSGPRVPPGITFDRFVRCCVTVRTLTEAFRRADHDNDGWINVGYEQFMDMVLSTP